MFGDFTLDQKRYLEGFAAGLGAARPRYASAKPIGPDAIHIEAQDRFTASGGKLCDQAKWKREEHPFDAYPRLVAQAQRNEPPKPPDNFAAVANLAENFGGGYLHVTTRANIQIREIEPKNAAKIIEGVQDAGLWSKGSGADNIRNVTGTPTAGVDPRELIDTRPFARRCTIIF